MKVFKIFLIIAACSIFGANESFAQCGSDGLQACNSSGTSTKRQIKPKVLPKPVTAGKKNKIVTKREMLVTKDADYYFDYALNTCGETNYDCQITNNTKAIQLGAGAGAYNNRCYAYWRKELNELALSDCNKAIELKPDYAEAFRNRGAAYNNKKFYDRSIEDTTKSIKLKPNYAEAYNARATSYYYKQNYEQAIKDFSKAIELKPDYVFAYYNRGHSYQAKL